MKEKQDKSLAKVNREKLEPACNERTYVPVTDIYEKDDAILVRCDMPGVTQDQVDIHLDNDELEITGKQAMNTPEGYDLLIGEYGTGVFRRKFSIPQLIDREKIRARLHNGVLDIELPKAEQAKPRKIAVTSVG
ncbi:MAG: Hsp20/alpha crystallin family protein [Pontiellaceae bacterium]|nr:Hsp20/alpha crystallin family protein [Pontiellaceae bacterium]MBN2785779.1 Hsp20/alpha crystallin family protein [Pontiellaceae bacterium]